MNFDGFFFRHEFWPPQPSRGGDIHQAARTGDVPALRGILRADPESVHEKLSGGCGLKNC